MLERHGYCGELADHVMLTRAKLENTPRDGRIDLLRRARTIQSRMGNPIGVVRSTLLMARIAGTPKMAARARHIVERHRTLAPDLQTCSLLRCVLDRWDEWVAGKPCDRDVDPFRLL